MVKLINLKKSSFEGGFISAKFSKLYSDDVFESFLDLSFDEILKYMEEHDFKYSIDSSYINYEGFYLIEGILNKHISRIYSEIFQRLSINNKILLSSYYLKYQIHNFLALIRTFDIKEEELEVYLIGDNRLKSKYIKAKQMPKKEDAIVYISKKLKFDSERVLENYKKGLFYLENYLYKTYYEKLFSYNFRYNNIDEKKYISYLLDYVTLLNLRTYLKLKLEGDMDSFGDYYINVGRLDLNYFLSLKDLSEGELVKKIGDALKLDLNCSSKECYLKVDKLIAQIKNRAILDFSSVKFGSPFYVLKYLLEAEVNISKLRVLLKAKYMGLERDEIKKLIEGDKK